MDNKTISPGKMARTTGLLYLGLIIIGIYQLKYVQSQIVVKGDATATSNNILHHEFLFRTGVISSIAANFIFLLLALSFYRLLKQVNEYIAKLMVITVLVQIPICFMLD